MGGKSSQSTSQVSIPPQVLAQYQAVNSAASQLAQQPYQNYSSNPAAFVAPLTDTQNAGIANTNAYAGAAQPYYGAATDVTTNAYNASQPYYGSAGQTTANAVNTAQPYYGAASGLTMAGAGGVAPGQLNTNQYMSPYLNDVVGTQLAAQNLQNAQQSSALQGSAIQAGAFGGDRSGIAQANLAQQQAVANQAALANTLQTGYTQAQNTAANQQGVQLSADQANQARLLAAGNQMGNLGTQQGQLGLAGGAQMANIGTQQNQAGLSTAGALQGLGTAAQTAGLQGAQAQLAAGQTEQQTQQAGLTALLQQYQAAQSLPYQNMQMLLNAALGTGAQSGSTTSTTAPSSFFSDERLKEDVQDIGRTFDGQRIIKFRYKGEKGTQIGLSAQDVEKHHPNAIGGSHGYKTVDYDAATKKAADRGHFYSGGLVPNSQGGLVAPEHAGMGFADGGAPSGGAPAGGAPAGALSVGPAPAPAPVRVGGVSPSPISFNGGQMAPMMPPAPVGSIPTGIVGSPSAVNFHAPQIQSVTPTSLGLHSSTGLINPADLGLTKAIDTSKNKPFDYSIFASTDPTNIAAAQAAADAAALAKNGMNAPASTYSSATTSEGGGSSGQGGTGGMGGSGPQSNGPEVGGQYASGGAVDPTGVLSHGGPNVVNWGQITSHPLMTSNYKPPAEQSDLQQTSGLLNTGLNVYKSFSGPSSAPSAPSAAKNGGLIRDHREAGGGVSAYGNTNDYNSNLSMINDPAAVPMPTKSMMTPSGGGSSGGGGQSDAATAAQLIGTIASVASMFSDERLKEDVQDIGRTFDGQRIIKFRYKGEPGMQIGLSAQDVEHHHPNAVSIHHGYKAVNYDAATKKAANRGHFYSGGLVPEGRHGYATDGTVDDSIDPNIPPTPTTDIDGNVIPGLNPRGMTEGQKAAVNKMQNSGIAPGGAAVDLSGEPIPESQNLTQPTQQPREDRISGVPTAPSISDWLHHPVNSFGDWSARSKYETETGIKPDAALYSPNPIPQGGVVPSSDYGSLTPDQLAHFDTLYQKPPITTPEIPGAATGLSPLPTTNVSERSLPPSVAPAAATGLSPSTPSTIPSNVPVTPAQTPSTPSGIALPTQSSSISPSNGNFMQRNQDWLVPLLSGIGGMASSNSRYLGSAMLQGLGAGAGAYESVQNQATTRAGTQADTSKTNLDTAKKAFSYIPNFGMGVYVTGPNGQIYPIHAEEYTAHPEKYSLAGQTSPTPYQTPSDTSSIPPVSAQTKTSTLNPAALAYAQADLKTPYTSDAAFQASASAWDKTRLGSNDMIATANNNKVNLLETGTSLVQGGVPSGPYSDYANKLLSTGNQLASVLGKGPNYFSDSTTQQDLNNKLITMSAGLNASSVDQNSLQAFTNYMKAFPSRLMDPAAASIITSNLMTANQKLEDRGKFIPIYGEANHGSPGTHFESAFNEQRPQQNYAAEQKILAKLVSDSDTGQKILSAIQQGKSTPQSIQKTLQTYGQNNGIRVTPDVYRYFVSGAL